MAKNQLRRLKWRVREALQRHLPRLTLAMLANRTSVHEPELELLPVLAGRNALALDVGANKGVYCYHLARCFARVVAFEPQPELARFLARSAPANVEVRNAALSSAAGTGILRMPRGFDEEATLESKDDAGDWEMHEVRLMALDSLDLGAVSLMKIDVEGHELAVLEGARQTLTRDQPAILIEVEERHGAGNVARVRALLEELGFRGYFLKDRNVRPLADFDLARDQDPAHVVNSVKVGHYVNNFMFFPAEEAEARARAIERWLAAPASARHDMGSQRGAGLEPAWHGLFSRLAGAGGRH